MNDVKCRGARLCALSYVIARSPPLVDDVAISGYRVRDKRGQCEKGPPKQGYVFDNLKLDVSLLYDYVSS